jgi:hypothetical protein
MEPQPILHYYGTSLTTHGHYVFTVEDGRLVSSRASYEHIPFDPYKVVDLQAPKGTVKFIQFPQQAALAIVGSCTDKRQGTVSVFWIEGRVTEADFKARLLATPLVQQLLAQMTFTVQW